MIGLVIIKNLKKNKDGSYDFDFSVSNDEAEALMDFAIRELIREGAISVSGESEEDMEFAFAKDNEEGTLQ